MVELYDIVMLVELLGKLLGIFYWWFVFIWLLIGECLWS